MAFKRALVKKANVKKKCRKAKYVQRRVCFVNVQFPWPHSNTYVKLCTSHLCMKLLSFLFVHTWAMPHILYLSCGIPFPVWTPGIISGLTSVMAWLSWGEVIKKNDRTAAVVRASPICSAPCVLHQCTVVFAWAMPRILYLSCGIPFPVWTPGIISGLTSVVVWLSRWEVINKKCQVIF